MVNHLQSVNKPASAAVTESRKKHFNFANLCKAYLSLIGGCCSRFEDPLSFRSSASLSSRCCSDPRAESIKVVGVEVEEVVMNGIESLGINRDSIKGNCGGYYKNRSVDNFIASVCSPGSRKPSSSPSPRSSIVDRSGGRASVDSINGFPPSLSRNSSRSCTPIMFSNSTGLMKPQAIQRDLECTLEELCHGCKKRIKVTRDVQTRTGFVYDDSRLLHLKLLETDRDKFYGRAIIQEEEILTIKVKPGWKKGTKITFEGMGNETAGSCPADITFVIAEKRHPLFRREGDDLEIAVEIPLVKALTGCEISIPLLGGESRSLSIDNVDNVVHPGHEVIIPGQGMPKSKQQRSRGDLKVIFLVAFPTELSDEQRLEIVSILGNSC